MNNIRTPPAFDVPETWLNADFALKEIAHFTRVPATTIDLWLATSRLYGHWHGLKRGRRRLYSEYHLLAIGLLSRLHKVGFPVGNGTINAAFRFANDECGAPRTRFTQDEIWTVEDVDGAKLTVDGWLTFIAVRAWTDRQRRNAAA